MKKLRWILAGIITTFGVTALAATVSYFTDEGSFDPWFKSAVNKMQNEGIMTGYPDGSFKPMNDVNRAELAVMFDRFATLMGKPLLEESPGCDLSIDYGLNVMVQDQKGAPIIGAHISAQKYEGLPADTDFFEKGNGMYDAIAEGEGYYTFRIEKAGYTTHTETIKLEKNGCHVISQTRTITLIQL